MTSRARVPTGSRLARFVDLCAEGDDEGVLASLEDGPELASAYEALASAAARGQGSVLRLLLERGASALASNPQNPMDTALYRALSPKVAKHDGHLEVVRVLVEQGADLHAPTPFQGLSALRLAASSDTGGALVALLLELGARPTLHDLAAIGELEGLGVALSGGGPNAVDARDNKGRTPLMAASASRHWRRGESAAARALAVAELLLERGANLDLRQVDADPWSSTALRWSVVAGGHVALTRLLLERGARPALCLVQAALMGRRDHGALLLRFGADPNERSVRGHTPLVDALLFKRLELVDLLLESGADPTLTTPKGHSALHVAAVVGHEAEVLRALIKNGADPKAIDAEGRRPVDLARSRGKAEVVAFFETSQ